MNEPLMTIHLSLTVDEAQAIVDGLLELPTKRTLTVLPKFMTAAQSQPSPPADLSALAGMDLEKDIPDTPPAEEDYSGAVTSSSA